MTKVSIVGGGNAGCMTALYLSWYKSSHNIEVELMQVYTEDELEKFKSYQGI